MKFEHIKSELKFIETKKIIEDEKKYENFLKMVENNQDLPENISCDFDDDNKYIFYEDLTDEEIEASLKAKQAKDINTIKNISVFFTVLFIISFIISLIILL